MAPERVSHVRAKAAAYDVLARAIDVAGRPCEAFTDGPAVCIDAMTAYEPDALVHCGPRLPVTAIDVPEPVVIVEVLSPGTRRVDAGAKLAGYFTLPSLCHDLVVDADRRRVVHQARGEAARSRLASGKWARYAATRPGSTLRREPGRPNRRRRHVERAAMA